MSLQIEVPHSRDNAVLFFQNYVAQNNILKGKEVYDLSAGSGYIAHLFEEVGANVKPFDLFPEQNTFATSTCLKIDLQNKLSLHDSVADIVILGETIEHLPNQFFFFQEAARIMKRGGIFILTTPNSSSLRSRLAQFLMESEHYSNAAPNELDAYTRWDETKGEQGYFSKLFISGILRLRTLAAVNGLIIKTIHPSSRSSTSILLLIFYPLIYFFSRKNFKKQIKKDSQNKSVYKEIFSINTSMKVLLGKHLMIEFVKK